MDAKNKKCFRSAAAGVLSSSCRRVLSGRLPRLSTFSASSLLLALFLPAGVMSARPQVTPTSQLRTEEQLLDVLKSGAPLDIKDAAFAELKRAATAKSVPVLAELLTSAEFSHSARYVLESLPAPEAGTALIAALGKTSGLLKIGIIDSLGRRHESAAVQLLAALLGDPDQEIVRASASALGEIGGNGAVKSLFDAYQDDTGKETSLARQRSYIARPLPALFDALLAIANRSIESGDEAGAQKILERLRFHDPAQIYTELDRGLIASGAYSGLTGLKNLANWDAKSMRSPIAVFQTARELEDPGATRFLCSWLGTGSPFNIPLIEALRQRGDPAAAPAILAVAANADPDVRIAAIGALGDLGDEKALPLLLTSARSQDEAESRAARQALLDLRRGPIADALISSLETGDTLTQTEASRALAGRGDPAAVPGLISLARGESAGARPQTLAALGRLAKAEHIKELVALVVDARDEEGRGQAGEALRSACARLDGWGIAPDPAPIISALGSASPEARKALFPAAAALRDSRVREMLRSALSGPDPALADAAFFALCDTRDPELLPDLGKAAVAAAEPTRKIQALRGYVRLAGNTEDSLLSPFQRVEAFRKILPLVARPEEKWQMLSALAKIRDPGALELALPMMDDPATKAEAAEAVLKIAAALPVSQPGSARTALDKVLARVSDPAQRQAAAEAVRKIDEAAGTLPRIAFKRLTIDTAFRSEGLAVADFNRDGRLDIATGNILYLGPDWKPQPMLSAAREYKPEGYSNEFLCFAEDVDRDGWTDLVVVGFPGAQTRWLRNPGKSAGPWQEFVAVEKAGNESPDWLDADGDGRKELVFVSEKGMAFARPGRDPKRPWAIQVIASPSDPAPGHGLGVGDVNGDGRLDVLCGEGWWEGPAGRTTKPWTFHKAKLGYEAAAQLVVLDVDGDGDADVVSSAAHRYGLWWYEQTPAGWVPHEVDRSMSQLHALHAADLDGDGMPEFVTGKRFWAHREGDEGIDDPAILCWFDLSRAGGQVTWVRHDIDYDSGVGLHIAITDIDGDGRPDIVTSNKKGVFLFPQERR